MSRAGLLAAAVMLIAPHAGAQVPRFEPPAPTDSARAAVLAFVESYYDAFSERDWDRFQEHFWPGATIATVWQPPGTDQGRVEIQGIPAFVARAHEGPGSKPIFEERMTSAEVRWVGGLATVLARYRARFGEPGQVAEWEGVDAFVLLRHEGRWRIASLSFVPE